MALGSYNIYYVILDRIELPNLRHITVISGTLTR